MITEMTNKERIAVIDNMLDDYQDHSGLCDLFRSCWEGEENLIQFFPAIKFFAFICNAHNFEPMQFWWQPGEWKQRIATLKLLRLWYNLKIIL